MIRSPIALAVLAVSCCHVDSRAGMQLEPAESAAPGWQAPPPRPQVVVAAPQDAPKEAPAQDAPKPPPGEPKPDAPPKSDAAPANPANPANPATPVVSPGADETDEQRAHDEIAFENEYLRLKERLVPEQLGKWVAIVDGRVLPTDARGKIAPAPAMAECLAAADAAHEKALHRFVFQVGEEGDIFYADPSRSARSLVGTAFKATLGIVAGFDVRTGELQWSRGEKSRRFKFEHDRFEVTLSDPLQRQTMATPVADSSGFGGFLLLEAADATLLDGARFEIPGRVLLKTGDGIAELRRTRIRVKVPELDVDVTVPAAAWPK